MQRTPRIDALTHLHYIGNLFRVRPVFEVHDLNRLCAIPRLCGALKIFTSNRSSHFASWILKGEAGFTHPVKFLRVFLTRIWVDAKTARTGLRF
jgi:hypothetical protein